jgi:hypothetical protein
MSYLGASRKYLGSQNPDLYGASLTWPGAHNLPVLGQFDRLLKQDEVDDAEIVGDFHARKFDTWDADSVRLYEQIMDRVVNGQFLVRRRTPEQWVPEHGGWSFWMEWVQLHVLPPRSDQPRY